MNTDNNSALTLHHGCLWFLMRPESSFSGLCGDLHGWGEGGHSLVGGNYDCMWVNGLVLLTFDP